MTNEREKIAISEALAKSRETIEKLRINVTKFQSNPYANAS